MSPEKLEKLKQDIVFEEKLRGHTLTFHSTWGLFNPRRVDEGSRLLIDHLQVAPLLTHLASPADCQAVYEGLTGSREEYLGAVFDWALV